MTRANRALGHKALGSNLGALVTTLFLLAIPQLALAKGKGKPPEFAPYTIGGLEAKLFYDGTATFSRNVLAEPAFRFWNTIIGEGEAEGPSNSTLLLVQVSGNPSEDVIPPRRTVEITAKSGRQTLLKKSMEIGLFKDGKYYAAVWLYDTGCMPIDVTARLTGQKLRAVAKATIPFACGE